MNIEHHGRHQNHIGEFAVHAFACLCVLKMATAEWHELYNGFYRRHELFDMVWDADDPSHIAIAPFGGPIGMMSVELCLGYHRDGDGGWGNGPWHIGEKWIGSRWMEMGTVWALARVERDDGDGDGTDNTQGYS